VGGAADRRQYLKRAFNRGTLEFNRKVRKAARIMMMNKTSMQSLRKQGRSTQTAKYDGALIRER
jgi:hypothetical protein